MILESNVTPHITRSSDSFSTVQPIVNAGDLGMHCDLETIIVLVFLTFNFNNIGIHSKEIYGGTNILSKIVI